MFGGGHSKIFFFHPENWGDDSHFDEHIFQRGWFNHQLALVFGCQLISRTEYWASVVSVNVFFKLPNA